MCDNNPVGVGDSCVFSCLDGYEITGSDILVCQNDGTFDRPYPVCAGKIFI